MLLHLLAHVLAGEPVSTPDQVRGRLWPGHAHTLLGIDLDRLDQLAPLRDLAPDALAESNRRAAARVDAVAAEALDQLRRAHGAIAGGGELFDHRRRRAGGHHHTDPQD